MPVGHQSPKTAMSDLPECWPPLPLASWKETYALSHMWTQIVGKVRMSQAFTGRKNSDSSFHRLLSLLD